MKSLSNHSAFTDHPGTPPKLKPFKALSQKLSRSAWKGILGITIAVGIVGAASEAQASYLKRGAVGPSVADVQAALGIAADGVFGCQTQSAVIDFQRRNGLLADGVVGPQTWTALFGVGSPVAVSTPISSSYTPVGNNILEPGIEPPSAVLPPAVIGPYVVVVPYGDQQRLIAVKQVVPDAVLDGAPQGSFINAGGYPNYSSAREVAGRLRGFGFDARVNYFQRYEASDSPPEDLNQTFAN